MDKQPTAGDAQPQLEPLVIQRLGRTVAIVCESFKAAIAPTAGIATDRQRQRSDDLYRIGTLATDLRQALLDQRFNMPEIRGLPHGQCSVRQLGKEVRIMGTTIGKEIFVGGELEVFAAEFHRNDFFVTQRRGKSP